MIVDSHSHILPELDDGAQSLEEAVAMARAAARSGTDAIIATPHHGDGRYENDARRIRASVERLNAELESMNISLRVLPGQEIAWNGALLEELDNQDLLSLNDSVYLLLELPHYEIPRSLDETIYELELRGYVPVIAHPERNLAIIDRPDQVRRLTELGAIMQVTAGSLLGKLGRKAERTAFYLCERGLAHLVASDGHNSLRSVSELADGYGLLERKFGTAFTEGLRLNARCLLNKQDRMIPVYRPSKRKWWTVTRRSDLNV